MITIMVSTRRNSVVEPLERWSIVPHRGRDSTAHPQKLLSPPSVIINDNPSGVRNPKHDISGLFRYLYTPVHYVTRRLCVRSGSTATRSASSSTKSAYALTRTLSTLPSSWAAPSDETKCRGASSDTRTENREFFRSIAESHPYGAVRVRVARRRILHSFHQAALHPASSPPQELP
jgi:hypothetical protein